MNAKTTLLSCGPLASLLYLATVAVGGAIRPGYSHLADAVSELTASGAPNKALMDGLFLAYNGLVAVFAIGLFLVARDPDKSGKRSAIGGLGALLLAVSAICGALLQLFFPQDPGGPPVTAAGTLHIAVASIAALATMVAIVCVALWFRRVPAFRPLASYSYVTFVVMLVSGGLGAAAAGSRHPLMGLVERVTLGAIMLWLCVTGARLASLSRHAGAAGADRRPTSSRLAGTEDGRVVTGLLVLAAASAAAVVLGPLGIGRIEWRVSANALNQTYGADAAQLALTTPATLAAAWLWWRGSRAAGPLALGVGLATLYYAVASVLGPDYLRYPGNNERFFLLFLTLIVLGWTVAARAWSSLDAQPPPPSKLLARGFGTLLVAGGGLIGAAWLVQLVDIARVGALSSPADAQAYAEAPSAFWTIRVVDLGFIAPACLAAGVGLWRGSSTAVKAAYGLASFITLQSAAVLAMGVVMLWRDDPTATPALVYALLPISLGGAVLTLRLFMSYSRTPTPKAADDRARRVGDGEAQRAPSELHAAA